MRLIPAIDIIDGKCVRLSKGDFATKKIYNEDPLEVAKSFEDHGLRYLHLVDLDGAISHQIVNYNVLYKIATHTDLLIDFGGGIKSEKDVKIAFENGANQITVGSLAVDEPETVYSILEKYGAQKIILGADCEDRMIATNGWLKKTELDIIEFIEKYTPKGLEYVICTDIEKDGMLQGPSSELYEDILKNTTVKLIASGGVASMQNLIDMDMLGCEGTIIGKAIYEKKISLKDLKELC